MSAVREPTSIRVLRATIIIVAMVLTCAPVLYGVLLSLRPFAAALNDPLSIVPSLDEISIDAYVQALRSTADGGYGLGGFLLNSLILAAGTVLASILVSILGAYATARIRFSGRSVGNAIIVAVYMFPGIVLAVPLFVLLSRAGLTSSLAGLVIVYVALTVPVSLYMLRNYFIALPASIEDAAMIDGCSILGVIWRIVLPIALPGIAATAMYIFMIAWNEYLYALLFLVQSRDLWTAPLGIAQLTEFDTPVTILLAGSIVVTIPVVLLFVLAQRLLISGLATGAEK
ncbi:carbohydrate ABC transporter permease [Ruania alba]|uniref:Carbohydrate ABC transporter membrane protein 2, CUT1 family n=1 Tax=Ruania alba TaxID=648782 RepID=A0A1H5KKW1_9MICO|nr:carbohydrate ABC transporter permease [Ruania alba]SEE65486.1 carbohydrate ABC transporter membrane protein 2, CUT1 family [Ruania alba]